MVGLLVSSDLIS